MANPVNPRYVIIRAKNTALLVRDVDPKLEGGIWQCVGAPFYDKDFADWCQTLQRVEQPVSDLRAGSRPVKLREPGR